MTVREKLGGRWGVRREGLAVGVWWLLELLVSAPSGVRLGGRYKRQAQAVGERKVEAGKFRLLFQPFLSVRLMEEYGALEGLARVLNSL